MTCEVPIGSAEINDICFFKLACQLTPTFATPSSRSKNVKPSSTVYPKTSQSPVITSSSITAQIITPYLTEPELTPSAKMDPVMTSSYYTEPTATELSSSSNAELIITSSLTDPVFMSSSSSEPVKTSSYREATVTSSYTEPTPAESSKDGGQTDARGKPEGKGNMLKLTV